VIGAIVLWLASATPDQLAQQLHAIGDQKVHELDRPVTAADELFVMGQCVRPTAAERAAIQRRVAAWAHGDATKLGVQFGCTERTGVVIDAVLDRGYGAAASCYLLMIRRSWSIAISMSRRPSCSARAPT
jgi:hypothetical protein